MSFETVQSDTLTPIVARVFRIDNITWGNPDRDYIVRYRGQLLLESTKAFDQLSSALRQAEVTPLFREEEGEQAIILLQGISRPRPSNPWINLLLFLITVFSVVLAGTIYTYSGPSSESALEIIRSLFANLGEGIPFAVSILAILLAHEFGHYLAGRFHRTAVTLPYFLPFPFSPFGTLGAFIQLKEPPKNKRVLLDIGIAGPLAGLVVAIPVLLIGLSLSEVDQLPVQIPAGSGFTLEGNSILYLFAKFVVFGEWLPSPASYGGTHPLVYWIRYFFTGFPTPLGGTDVLIHPVAWAGWAGLLVTALNLIPAGQLDGGHLIYTLFGRRAQAILPFILGALLVLGLVWSGWWLWAVLIFLLGRTYAEPLDQITTLDQRRRIVAIAGLIIFVLVFTPVPLRALMGPFLGP
jgi:membrane-associated protease RseP (regulator of RpoE activity)